MNNKERRNHQKIEKKWQDIWKKKKVHEPDLDNPKNPFLNLMMFPYPSAEGLHAGNMYAFTGADIYGRFKRMQGNEVFEPIGLDGFGIHSENHALKMGTHPLKQSKISEKRFYKQLEMIGNSYAWDEKIETYDPDYYRWTQWIFIQMWKKGLVYRSKQAVNWCPSCKTVLADEQVIGGECERCGAKIEKKELEQWFFRITKYADKLLNNLDNIDWSEKVKIAQRNWIGKSEGADIEFKLRNIAGQDDGKHSIRVFTTRPETLFGATFLVISPELAQKWIDDGWQLNDLACRYITKALKQREEIQTEDVAPKNGVKLNICAVNPANDDEIPLWVSNYVLGSYGTGAIMAVPAHDARDFAFAKQYGISIRQVIDSKEFDENIAFEGNGKLINSGLFTGMNSEEVKWKIVEKVNGKRNVHYHLRDWLISRQRYWGPPIPMIYCKNCAMEGKGEQKDMPGWYAVPEEKLPVKLPVVKEFRPTGRNESPLASIKSFYEVNCPACNSKARRETDVSDTFLDSSWYFFRYIDNKNKKQIFDPKRSNKWLPVNMYIGGAEHSVLHLLYTRFITMVFNDMGLIDFDEPFLKFRAHGLIIKDGAKMSKSKGNIVNPDEYIKNVGADVLRTYLMFLAPFQDGGDFQDNGMQGIQRFFDRLWNMVLQDDTKEPCSAHFDKLLHQTIKKVTNDIEQLQYNTAISALMILLNTAEKEINFSTDSKKIFLKLLNPFAPHMCHELWSRIGMKTILDKETWPAFDISKIQETDFDLVIQINGKTRNVIQSIIGISQKEAESIALQDNDVKKWVDGKNIKNIIFIQNRLINFIVE